MRQRIRLFLFVFKKNETESKDLQKFRLWSNTLCARGFSCAVSDFGQLRRSWRRPPATRRIPTHERDKPSGTNGYQSNKILLEFQSFLSLNYGETKTLGRWWFDQSLDDQSHIITIKNKEYPLSPAIIVRIN